MTPYGVEKHIGGDSKENTKYIEDCVNGISGENKKTGKPYTKGEKIAICKASMKNKESELTEAEIEIVITQYYVLKNKLANKLARTIPISAEDSITQAEYLLSTYRLDEIDKMIYLS